MITNKISDRVSVEVGSNGAVKLSGLFASIEMTAFEAEQLGAFLETQISFSESRSLLPHRDDNPGGLHRRYNLSKADGSKVDENATYFVLRLDDFSDDIEHVRACREAALAYAKAVSGNPRLCEIGIDLRKLVSDLELTESGGQYFIGPLHIDGEVVPCDEDMAKRLFHVHWLVDSDSIRGFPLGHQPFDLSFVGWWRVGVKEAKVMVGAILAVDHAEEVLTKISGEWPECLKSIEDNGFQKFEELPSDFEIGFIYPVEPWMQERLDNVRRS